MTPREKILSIGVGIAVLAAVGSYGLKSIKKGFDDKNTLVDQLRSERDRRNTEITDGLLDRQKINTLVPRSLPSNPEKAQSEYNKWLISLINSSGLSSFKQGFNSRDTQEKGVYRIYKFDVSGVGTVENLTKLLHTFYEKDYLHRIVSLKISPISNKPYQLDIALTGEVMALDLAAQDQAEPTWPSYRISKSLSDYMDQIVGRNLFSPANHAPNWPESATVDAIAGAPFKYSPAAKDVDAGQRVRYEVVGEVPEGMTISASGEEVSWLPAKTGTYEITLKATDDGLPKQSSMQKLAIKVVDPPPPVPPAKEPPKLDIASQAEVSALITGRDGPEAWVRSKIEGKTFFLKVGDDLSLGSVKGKVVAVGANYLELETDGKRWTVGLDESLADAYRRIKID